VDYFECVKNEPDPDSKAPSAQDFQCVHVFLEKVRPDASEALDVPHIMAGPNGELFLNWNAVEKKHRLDLVFFNGAVQGLLRKDQDLRKASTFEDALSLVAYFASSVFRHASFCSRYFQGAGFPRSHKFADLLIGANHFDIPSQRFMTY
jgi:hypothetical protein